MASSFSLAEKSPLNTAKGKPRCSSKEAMERKRFKYWVKMTFFSSGFLQRMSRTAFSRLLSPHGLNQIEKAVEWFRVIGAQPCEGPLQRGRAASGLSPEELYQRSRK